MRKNCSDFTHSSIIKRLRTWWHLQINAHSLHRWNPQTWSSLFAIDSMGISPFAYRRLPRIFIASNSTEVVYLKTRKIMSISTRQMGRVSL